MIKYLIPIVAILALTLFRVDTQAAEPEVLMELEQLSIAEAEAVRDTTAKLIMIYIIRLCATTNKVNLDVDLDGEFDVQLQCFLQEPI